MALLQAILSFRVEVFAPTGRSGASAIQKSFFAPAAPGPEARQKAQDRALRRFVCGAQSGCSAQAAGRCSPADGRERRRGLLWARLVPIPAIAVDLPLWPLRRGKACLSLLSGLEQWAGSRDAGPPIHPCRHRGQPEIDGSADESRRAQRVGGAYVVWGACRWMVINLGRQNWENWHVKENQ